jgi:hypothetical protein
MSDKESKELGAIAKCLSESRECFIEVYIDNGLIIIIVNKLLLVNKNSALSYHKLSWAVLQNNKKRFNNDNCGSKVGKSLHFDL